MIQNFGVKMYNLWLEEQGKRRVYKIIQDRISGPYY
jgi:hypothetical protein